MVKAWSSIVKAVTDLPDNFPIQQLAELFLKHTRKQCDQKWRFFGLWATLGKFHMLCVKCFEKTKLKQKVAGYGPI